MKQYWRKPQKGIEQWLIWADRFYVSSRLLFWNDDLFMSAYLGAHAIELYLKTYLISKRSEFLTGHNINQLFDECRQYDDFFSNPNIAQYFTNEVTINGKNILWSNWNDYVNIFKYPEDLPSVENPRKNAFTITRGIRATIFWCLDEIACFIHQEIDDLIPGKQRVFVDLINGVGDSHGYFNSENILNSLFKENSKLSAIYNYFSENT